MVYDISGKGFLSMKSSVRRHGKAWEGTLSNSAHLKHCANKR